jgi:L-threonylcarbamoyladenylate synthase
MVPKGLKKIGLHSPVITLMLTRHPRIPNVKFAKHALYHSKTRALVPVAASGFLYPSLTALRGSLFSPEAISPFGFRAITTYLQAVATMDTNILAVDPQKLGKITFTESKTDLIEEWDIQYAEEGKDYQSLQRAAEEIVNTDTPVAFPTETVYGLGADATRSSAVKAIFAAKGRPSDNPLIVHIHSLSQLRSLLSPKSASQADTDPIPAIYKPLIERFWPGPLTIILPVPEHTTLAPEVTAGLPTFGARMPRSILALSLLRLCNRPLAGPSANASTRPSPTCAEHVFDDLQGRIHTIVDGGPCEVGVESTVVDGLSSPPSILRPGGVTVEQLRQCPGWEDVAIGYKDKQEGGASRPRAPGMKYRHYSPKAEVLLFEAGAVKPMDEEVTRKSRVGIIRTKSWEPALGLASGNVAAAADMNGAQANGTAQLDASTDTPSRLSNLLRSVIQHQIPHAQHHTLASDTTEIWDVALGAETEGVARGLFSALRELDKKGVEIIFVEGIDDTLGDDIAAAVMNRLRKAAEIRV